MTGAAATSARKIPRQTRSKLMVDAILDATAHILVARGFSGTTTNAVAQRAGVSIGSLYQYFPSREALVAAVAQRNSHAIKAALEALLADTQKTDLVTALRRMLAAITYFHAVNPALSRILATEVPRLGDMDWRQDIAARALAIAKAVLVAHQDALRPDLDLDSAAFVVAKASEAIMISLAPDANSSHAAAIVQALLDMLIAFLAGPALRTA